MAGPKLPRVHNIDGMAALIFSGMLIYTGIVIWLAFVKPNDGQTFQVMAGLLTAFSGAFFGRMDPKKKPTDPDPERTTTVKTEVTTPVPPEEPVP